MSNRKADPPVWSVYHRAWKLLETVAGNAEVGLSGKTVVQLMAECLEQAQREIEREEKG